VPRRELRIAVGQISAESDHFVSSSADLDFFRNTGYLHERAELLKLVDSTTEIAGILKTLHDAGDTEVIPLLAARANSAGPLSVACYDYLKERLLTPLKEAGKVDGVILSHHGSMAAVQTDDPEGDIASAVRDIVGPCTPLFMTLDLHGNVTRRMVQACSAILAYEHYPHDDVERTGIRGAQLLLRTVRGEVRPVTAHAKLPMLLTAFNAGTAWDGPFALLLQQAKLLERETHFLSSSLFFVGSYLDMPDIGCSALVVTDGDGDLAIREAKTLAQAFWDSRSDFKVETLSVAEAIRRGRQIAGGPVLLLDTADTTGGGASGDGIGLVKGLLAERVTEACLAMVVDPKAAKLCTHVGVGNTITLEIGHRVDSSWGSPIEVSGKVLRTTNGRFQYTGGVLGGTWVSMGPSAVLQIGSIQLLIMTYPTYDWADEQYRSAGLHPEHAKFVGVKNMMNFRFGYQKIMKGFFVLDLPGPTPPDMRMLSFKRVRRPLFPLDEELSSPEIQISTSKYS
jgi:microcystin degradation protein MlrC